MDVALNRSDSFPQSNDRLLEAAWEKTCSAPPMSTLTCRGSGKKEFGPAR